jgi:Pretoxin HINT domain
MPQALAGHERIAAEDDGDVVMPAAGVTEVIRATPGHPFWVDGSGWVAAGDLTFDEHLRTSAGDTVRVLAGHTGGAAETVYNFEVEGWHTYFVGRLGALVHNGCESCVPPGASPAEASPTSPEGSFSIVDWTGYPAGMPRPTGPFRVLTGEDYAAARALANETNATIRAENGLEESGMHIHEIQPVKFGGSPTDMANKMLLPAADHIGPNGVHPRFWTPLLKSVTGGGG